MTTRRRNLLALLATLAVAAAGFVLAQGGDEGARGAAAAIPADAFLVVSVDVDALRASPLGKTLEGALPGFGQSELATLCGFDPLAKVHELAVALPEAEGDFGVVAVSELRSEELVPCAQKVIAARGGAAKVSRRGRFTMIEADDAANGAPRIALRDGGLLVVGRGPWHEAMLETSERRRRGLDPRGPHAKLRADLTALAAPPARPPAVLATAVLPKGLRDRLRAEMAGDAEPSANAAFAGVLAVESAGVAVRLGREGEASEVAARLQCETTGACDEVKKLIERKRLALSKELGVRLIGLGPLIDSLAVSAEGPTLRASARAHAEDVARAVDRIMKLRAPRAPLPPASAASSASPPAPRPDEVLSPRRADAGPDAAR